VAVYAISVKSHTAHAGPNKVANKLHYNSVLYPDETISESPTMSSLLPESGIKLLPGHLEI